MVLITLINYEMGGLTDYEGLNIFRNNPNRYTTSERR